MGEKSAIEWTNSTWNVVTGCDKVSPGCKNCYAERYALRLKKMGVKKYVNGFKLTFHPDVMNYPLTLKQPRRIFVNSMSDLFHEDISIELIT
jgi:protein gp37